ncbi:hypothetical protein GCM10007159_40460 [Modicisalibacter luteus]|nr:hypothetical protein GCM10007159_40460 [Halomonas lutea]
MAEWGPTRRSSAQPDPAGNPEGKPAEELARTDPSPALREVVLHHLVYLVPDIFTDGLGQLQAVTKRPDTVKALEQTNRSMASQTAAFGQKRTLSAVRVTFASLMKQHALDLGR